MAKLVHFHHWQRAMEPTRQAVQTKAPDESPPSPHGPPINRVFHTHIQVEPRQTALKVVYHLITVWVPLGRYWSSPAETTPNNLGRLARLPNQHSCQKEPIGHQRCHVFGQQGRRAGRVVQPRGLLNPRVCRGGRTSVIECSGPMCAPGKSFQ